MALMETTVKVLISEVIKKTLPPIVDKLIETKDKLDHHFNNKFSKYLETKYNKLDLSTSQLFRNANFQISKLYVPLTLENSIKHHSIQVNQYPSSLFNTNNKILIKDTAGMGKSTLLKMIFRYAIDENKLIPFYIDMKALIKKEKIISVIDSLIQDFPSYTNVPKEIFLKILFENSNFLFLFDGADEVPDKFKNDVYNEINHFVDIANKSNFIIATRDEDQILSSFNNFLALNIKELEKAEAYQLIKNYDISNEVAESLILEINKIENNQVFEFLKNPLLVTLLFTAYSYTKKIPLKKNIFFKQVYQSLYENHDATKIGFLSREKSSGLDIDEFEIVLSQLAFHGRIKEKLEYTLDELIELLQKINTSLPTINFKPRDFIKDILSRVPLLKKDGQVFKWQHKSIQEYFFVQFLFKVLNEEKRISAAKQIFNSKNISKYKLIFDILYDENIEFFHDNFTLPVLNLYIKETCDEADYFDCLDYYYKYWIEYENIDLINHDHMFNNVKNYFVTNIEDNISKEKLEDFKSNYSLSYIMTSYEYKKATILFAFYFKHQMLLEILFNKKHDFIVKFASTLNLDETINADYTIEKILKTERFIENISKHSTKEFIIANQELFKKYIVVNRKEAQDFINNYNCNKQKKEKIICEFKDLNLL